MFCQKSNKSLGFHLRLDRPDSSSGVVGGGELPMGLSTDSSSSSTVIWYCSGALLAETPGSRRTVSTSHAVRIGEQQRHIDPVGEQAIEDTELSIRWTGGGAQVVVGIRGPPRTYCSTCVPAAAGVTSWPGPGPG